MAADARDRDAQIVDEAEAIFAAFVRNANQLAHDPRTVRAALQAVAAAAGEEHDVESEALARDVRGDDDAATGRHVIPRPPMAAVSSEAGMHAADHAPDAPSARWDDVQTSPAVAPDLAAALPLTRRRSTVPPAPRARLDAALRDAEVRSPGADDALYVPPSPRGLTTQRREAHEVVPDVASVAPPPRLAAERGEDGEMPPRELERVLSDMAALLRWGHAGQVRDELAKLRARYPDDLLLARRVAEFHLEAGQHDAAMEVLFALAGQLFARRNVEGMRAALEQVRVLDPHNERAARLLALLARRDSELPPPR
jgi:hypothetical protein